MRFRISRRTRRRLWEAVGFVALTIIGILIVQWFLYLFSSTVRSQ